MRYTTIIDITELTTIYRNVNARLVYLHLVLRCGYHDADRDITDISIRQLAAAVGLTESATRHALRQLSQVGLITRQGRITRVTKWVTSKDITPRPKSERQQKRIQQRQEEERQRDEEHLREELEKQQRLELRRRGKTPFMLYYEDQERKAAAGDMQAKEVVLKRRQQYEEQKKILEEEMKNEQ